MLPNTDCRPIPFVDVFFHWTSASFFHFPSSLWNYTNKSSITSNINLYAAANCPRNNLWKLWTKMHLWVVLLRWRLSFTCILCSAGSCIQIFLLQLVLQEDNQVLSASSRLFALQLSCLTNSVVKSHTLIKTIPLTGLDIHWLPCR